MTRRSTAIGWRNARSLTVCSCTALSRASTRASAAMTCSAISESLWRSAIRHWVSAVSAKPPISLMVALSRSSSSSNRLRVCSAIFFSLSAEAAGDVGLGAAVLGGREQRLGGAELDQLAEIHEGREVRDARGLL